MSDFVFMQKVNWQMLQAYTCFSLWKLLGLQIMQPIHLCRHGVVTLKD